MTKSDHVRQLLRSVNRMIDSEIAREAGCTRENVRRIRVSMKLPLISRIAYDCPKCGKPSGMNRKTLWCQSCREERGKKALETIPCSHCGKQFAPDWGSIKRNTQRNPDYKPSCSKACVFNKMWAKKRAANGK